MTRQERSIIAGSRSGPLPAPARLNRCRASARPRGPGRLETARPARGAAVVRLAASASAPPQTCGGSDDSLSLLRNVRSRVCRPRERRPMAGPVVATDRRWPRIRLSRRRDDLREGRRPASHPLTRAPRRAVSAAAFPLAARRLFGRALPTDPIPGP